MQSCVIIVVCGNVIREKEKSCPHISVLCRCLLLLLDSTKEGKPLSVTSSWHCSPQALVMFQPCKRGDPVRIFQQFEDQEWPIIWKVDFLLYPQKTLAHWGNSDKRTRTVSRLLFSTSLSVIFDNALCLMIEAFLSPLLSSSFHHILSSVLQLFLLSPNVSDEDINHSPLAVVREGEPVTFNCSQIGTLSPGKNRLKGRMPGYSSGIFLKKGRC